MVLAANARGVQLEVFVSAQCSHTCGGGHQKRDVICKQRMADGSVLELPETFCPSSSLPTLQPCGLIDCPAQWVFSNWTQVRNMYSLVEKLISWFLVRFQNSVDHIITVHTFRAATGFMLFYCVFCVLNVTLKRSWQSYHLINCYSFRMTSLASPRLCYLNIKHRFIFHFAVYCHNDLTGECSNVTQGYVAL